MGFDPLNIVGFGVMPPPGGFAAMESLGYFRSVTPGVGLAVPPLGATHMRVTVVGGGGGGFAGNASQYGGGGTGGGCASTKIVPVMAVSYSVGAGGIGPADGQESSAAFGARYLVAYGGKYSAWYFSGTILGSGAIGGDYNFKSGDVVNSGLNGPQGGSGAAGPRGNGGQGGGSGVTTPTNIGIDDLPGGGQGTTSGGGAGTGAFGMTSGGGTALVLPPGRVNLWGNNGLSSGTGRDGGEMGGGAGSNIGGTTHGNGGPGGIVIEWFKAA